MILKSFPGNRNTVLIKIWPFLKTLLMFSKGGVVFKSGVAFKSIRYVLDLISGYIQPLKKDNMIIVTALYICLHSFASLWSTTSTFQIHVQYYMWELSNEVLYDFVYIECTTNTVIYIRSWLMTPLVYLECWHLVWLFLQEG